MTQRLNNLQIAEKLGISVSTLYKIKTGRIKNPDPKKVKALRELGIVLEAARKTKVSSFKAKRARVNLSLSKLQKLTGIKVSTLQAIESGRIKNPSELVKTALRVVLNLKTKPLWLVESFMDILISLLVLLSEKLVSLLSICDNSADIGLQLQLIPVINTIHNSQSK
jgi:transcriptional regulator with XRE-family HTH domain